MRLFPIRFGVLVPVTMIGHEMGGSFGACPQILDGWSNAESMSEALEREEKYGEVLERC